MGVEHVTEPTTTATLAMVFTIDSSVLYEICCFGMSDSEVKVSVVHQLGFLQMGLAS